MTCIERIGIAKDEHAYDPNASDWDDDNFEDAELEKSSESTEPDLFAVTWRVQAGYSNGE